MLRFYLSLSLLIADAFLPVLNRWFVCWRKDWVKQSFLVLLIPPPKSYG
jgi:hypothetical protein